MTTPECDFDITVLGTTGWTAKICAEHITKTSPTNLKRCIAGRSNWKLKALSNSLERLNHNRLAPVIHVVSELNSETLRPLVRKSRVVINGTGPYHQYSTPVVEACAKNGTHYVDFTTETLWIANMIIMYDNIAGDSGAIIIPAISNCSSPPDLLVWLIATHIKEQQHQPSHLKVICSGKLTMLGMAGGSLLTVLSMVEKYRISWLLAGDSYILSCQRKRRRKATSDWHVLCGCIR